MAKLSLKAGTTSKILYVFIQNSSVTTGAGLTGLVFNSAGLVASYVRPAAVRTAIALVTQTITGAYSSGGFVEVDATNMPGIYRLDIPDAAIAAAAADVVVMLKGATNMAPVVLEIELTAVDNQDAVRGGMTALPNAAAEAAGGLYTRGSGAGQINQPANGQIDANTVKLGGTTQTGRDIGASVLISPGTGAGQLDVTSGVIKANLAQILATALTETLAGYLAAAFKKLFDVAVPVLTSESVNQTGDSYARIGAAGAGLTALGDARIANLDAAVSSRSTYAGGAVASVTAGVTVTTNNDKTGYALSSAGVQAIWDALVANLTTVGSIGKKLADWVLGSDSKVLLSNNAHTGVTIPTVTAITNDVGITQAGADKVWSSAARTLTSFGTLVADIWAYATRTLSAFAFSVTLTAPEEAAIADAVWDELLADHLVAGSTGNKLNAAAAAAGAGATAKTYTLTDSGTGLPIADADIWVTTDLAGNNVIASGTTNASGQVVFYLDVGTTVYIWRQKSGYDFVNPDTEVV